MTKTLHEYELVWTFSEDDIEARKALEESQRRYYFTDEVAKDHNKQYALSDVPRKLVKVEDGKVVEKPEWWSGNIK